MDRKPCHVVLGSTGGIGSELCRQLLAAGANVVAGSRNSDTARELAETTGVRPFTLDATDIEQVAGCLADAQQTFGRVDGVATHRFQAVDGGTRMCDVVRCALPFGFLGRMAHAWVVKADLEGIFDYRARKVSGLLGNACSHA